jgi:DNA polymerase II small subunit
MAVESGSGLAARLSKFRILVAADADLTKAAGMDLDLLTARVIERFSGADGLKVLTGAVLAEIISALEVEKAPMPVEVERSETFKPIASEIEAKYSLRDYKIEKVAGSIDDFVAYFNNRLSRLRYIMESNRHSLTGILKNLEVIEGLTSGREVVVVGIVNQKTSTKNGNIMVILEDETASAKVIFMKSPNPKSANAFAIASAIMNDEVIAIRGKISGPFIIANEVYFPDIPVIQQKKSEDDVAVAFLSDIHVGSRYFMENNFVRMIKWLNGDIEHKIDLAGKIKYIVIAGDAIDGVGVYPDQEKNLSVPDVYLQYKLLFNFLDLIPDYIHIFVIPGNHDAVQRAEPQPAFGSDILGDFKRSNIHFLPNPSSLTIHGFNVLAYHGSSLDSVISAVPGASYAKPEGAMVEVLKRRHLSPIYGGNVVVPTREDNLIIEKVPDILHMGHVHKNGLANYHGVDIVNSGTWQSQTDFQIRQGHIPTPCVLPVLEMKTHTFTNINFNQ